MEIPGASTLGPGSPGFYPQGPGRSSGREVEEKPLVLWKEEGESDLAEMRSEHFSVAANHWGGENSFTSLLSSGQLLSPRPLQSPCTP